MITYSRNLGGYASLFALTGLMGLSIKPTRIFGLLLFYHSDATWNGYCIQCVRVKSIYINVTEKYLSIKSNKNVIAAVITIINIVLFLSLFSISGTAYLKYSLGL